VSRAPDPTPPPTDLHDQKLAAAALRKKEGGKNPSREEEAALRRVVKKKEAADRTRLLQAVPKVQYEEMSGRATGTLHKQAATYGLPALRGEEIDLYALVRQFHDLLANHGDKFRPGDEDDLLGGGDSPNLERYRKFKADNEKLTRDQRTGKLIERDKVREILAPLAASMARLGEDLRREHGEEAKRKFDDTLDQFQRLAHDLLTVPVPDDDLPDDDAPESPSPNERPPPPKAGGKRAATAKAAPHPKPAVPRNPAPVRGRPRKKKA
jgi:hypothetical protein